MLQGRRGGGGGGGGKEDIHVLLTEWRRKIKIKCMQGQKDREWRQILSMHSRTGVSVARCTLHMLINNMFYPPGCLGFAWVSAKTKNVGNLGAVAAPKAPKGLL